MKTASTALISFINATRASPDAPIAFADCFTFTLPSGLALTYTNVDQPIAYNGAVFAANGPLVQGLKYRCAAGLDVDKQQIVIAARPTDLVAGAMFLNALRDGAFDGCVIQRDRVFMTALGQPPIGGVTLFHGRISTVDQVGRTSAKITVASDLIILDMDMPKNLYAATCLHTLYDSGCGIIRGTYATSGTVGASSTASLINFSGALMAHQQGAILFTSGANANVRATVKLAVAGVSLTLIYPLPSPPTTGDAFTVYQGCDHTPATCKARFNNLANFRGFPYVPPPQIAY
ncbi:DUF2163 domain-containing protein [Methylocapsa sp. S129]|uniref:DUF2163 domain-containing protein n=1 Tax=Methylocapsa sp. S129 TaxID=1641869 RepID=UPI00131C2413|nr:DUF2163 domain-containing protein [Methylocapsa sp. S129]